MVQMKLRDECQARWPGIEAITEAQGHGYDCLSFSFPNVASGERCQAFIEKKVGDLDTSSGKGPIVHEDDQPAWRLFLQGLPHHGYLPDEPGYNE